MSQQIRAAAQALLDAITAVRHSNRGHDQLVAEGLAVIGLSDALASPDPTADAPTLVVLAGGREVWSCSGTELGAWQAMAGTARAQYMTTAQQQAAHQHEVALLGGAQPAGHAEMPVVAIYSPDEPVDEDGDERMPVVDLGDAETLAHKRRIQPHRVFDGLVRQSDAAAATAALQADLAERDARIAALEAQMQGMVRVGRLGEA